MSCSFMLLLVAQFDDEEDELLAAAVALPWWRRWFWLLALVLPLAASALVLAAGITVRVLYPQPVRVGSTRVASGHSMQILEQEGRRACNQCELCSTVSRLLDERTLVSGGLLAPPTWAR